MERRIQKHVDLKAPVSRVWQALTDFREFGSWFGVNLEGPFEPGKSAQGKINYPGFEHVRFEAAIQKIEPEHHFVFTWHPYAIDQKIDYAKEHPTLVEFKLEKLPTGSRLTVNETGFGKLPVSRREEAYQMNDQGWAEQMKRIEKYLAEHP